MKLAAITDVDLAHPGIVNTARLESLLRIGNSRSASRGFGRRFDVKYGRSKAVDCGFPSAVEKSGRQWANNVGLAILCILKAEETL